MRVLIISKFVIGVSSLIGSFILFIIGMSLGENWIVLGVLSLAYCLTGGIALSFYYADDKPLTKIIKGNAL